MVADDAMAVAWICSAPEPDGLLCSLWNVGNRESNDGLVQHSYSVLRIRK